MDESLFRNPPMSCRAVPFWSWNGKLDIAETRWQVRELADKGMGGGFIHSRSGLRTEYLGEEWFANCAAAIDEGKGLGFSTWLYDEDRWPSGACGGATAANHPEFRARTLLMRRGDRPGDNTLTLWGEDSASGDAELLGRFKVIQDRKEGFRKAEKGEDGPDVISFYSVVVPRSGWYNDGYSADMLHAGAVREFIRNTHEVYAARFQNHFGKEVPGIFTDEPTTATFMPWSVRLPEEFRIRRGYDLISKLPSIFFPTAEAPSVRHDFWKTVHELFNESCMTQLGSWCARHGLSLTGHVNCEHDLWSQIHSNGGCMEHYLHMQIPGIDILRERITEVATCKQASSICHQFNKPLMLSELYGCGGYTFSFESQKWIGDWQMALGVNFLCQHLTFYTMKGCAKRDYPPSYFYQSPWWRYYRHMADYQARLSYVLRQGHPVRDLLLIHPLTGAWCRFDPAAGREEGFGLLEQDRLFNQVMNHLLALHRDFDLGDEMVMARHARVEGNEMVVGSARYKGVIVPPSCNLESSTVNLLAEYVRAKGKLIWVGETPTLIEGKPSDQLRPLTGHKDAYSAAVHKQELEELLDALLPRRRVSVLRADTHVEAGKVLCQQREVDNGDIFFLANTDRDEGVSLKVRVPKKGAWRQWCCETGEIIDMPSTDTDAGCQVEIALAPAGSAVLHLDPNRATRSAAGKPAGLMRKKNGVPPSGWLFRRVAPNSLILDRCRYQINDDEFSEETFLGDAQEEWRRRLRIFPALRMNTDVQPWKRLQDPDSLRPLARLALKYSFQVETLPDQETYLVLEDRAEFEIHVNGSLLDAPTCGWFMDKSFEKVPMGKFLKCGNNSVELRTTLSAMRIIEESYVIGDFGVSPDTFAIASEPERLAAGDWCSQGYPFYTDGIIYETRFDLKEGYRGRVAVELEHFLGTVAAIWVNGQRAAVLGWRPYHADVTDYVRPGSNDLGIEIVGSPRNLMGPRHSAERYPLVTSSREMVETGRPDYHITPAGLTGGVSVVFSEEI